MMKFCYNGVCKKIQGGSQYFKKIFGGQVILNKWGVILDQGRESDVSTASKHLLSSHICGGGGWQIIIII